MVANRILLKPQFQDFDTTKCCHITVQQFARVLKQLNLMPSESTPIFELVCRRYADRGNLKEVNYVKFCQDIDRAEDIFAYMKQGSDERKVQVFIGHRDNKSNYFGNSTKDINVMESRFSQPTVNISNDPNDVENRLQAMVVMKRVRIREQFFDFDKLRKGKVTKNQFRQILSMLNFNLS